MNTFINFKSSGNACLRGSISHEQNHLIDALPQESCDRMAPDLERVHLDLGSILHKCGEQLRWVYFPIDCVVSLLCELEDGESGEVAVVGNEGLVGIAFFMGGGPTISLAVVQAAGFAFRIRADILEREFENGGALRELVLLYTHALITQMGQTALCNRHHTVEQQLCRRLLQSLDRQTSNELTMTQELIANNLGVRREGVTEAACKLRAAGWIDYHRGKIVVLNRPKLESRACECYAVVEKEFNSMLLKLGNVSSGDHGKFVNSSRHKSQRAWV